MATKKEIIKKPLLFLLLLTAMSFLWLPRALEPVGSAATGLRVHIAFGFHVNLYHSLRGDTNDENGFGQDIRAIRHILSETAWPAPWTTRS